MPELQLHPLGIIIGLAVGTFITLVLWWMLHPPKVGLRMERRAGVAAEVTKFAKILVPTQGTMFSDRMIALASKLAKVDLAQLIALYIVEVPLTLPRHAEIPEADRMGKEALEKARLIAKKFGVEITGRLHRARFAGQSIVDVAREENVDLIVMAASTKERFGEVTLGRTVDYVIKNAGCDVIVEKPAEYLR